MLHELKSMDSEISFMLICSWLLKNVQSFSGFFLSCSDSPDACNLLMPSAPSPRRIFNAFFFWSVDNYFRLR